mgnify:CR=1 FL=1
MIRFIRLRHIRRPEIKQTIPLIKQAYFHFQNFPKHLYIPNKTTSAKIKRHNISTAVSFKVPFGPERMLHHLVGNFLHRRIRPLKYTRHIFYPDHRAYYRTFFIFIRFCNFQSVWKLIHVGNAMLALLVCPILHVHDDRCSVFGILRCLKIKVLL